MYGAVVRRLTAEAFRRLGRGDWESLVERMAEDVHHVFPGDHPLGGERHTRAAVARWFERLDRLFPEHEFEVQRVVSRGWPWSTWVAVQWSARLVPRAGEPYVNEGAHWVELRWGRVTRFHAYLDTQLVAEACSAMAAEGVEEAAAPTIVA